MAAKATKYESAFTRGEAPASPDLACLGIVESVDEPISYDNNQTHTFKVNIRSLGSVPHKSSATVRIAAMFLEPGFNPDALFTTLPVEDTKDENDNDIYGARSYDKFYTENFTTREGETGYPHLLGLTGIDYEAYNMLGRALQALWPSVTTAKVKEVLEQHLVDKPVGYWLVQGVKQDGTYNKATGKPNYKRTQWFNIRTPRYEKAAYFKPDAEGRKKILSRIAGGKVNEATGKPFKASTFDESTSF